MNETGTYTSLRMAVLQALRYNGIGILDQPNRLLGDVLDSLNPHDPISASFQRNCDTDFLQIYSQAAAEGTPQAMSSAAQKAISMLVDNRMLRPEIAEQLACEIAFGISAYLGLDVSDWIREAATRGSTSSQGSVSMGNEYQPVPTVYGPPIYDSASVAPQPPMPEQPMVYGYGGPYSQGGSIGQSGMTAHVRMGVQPPFDQAYVMPPQPQPVKPKPRISPKRIAIIVAAAAVLVAGVIVAMNTIFAPKAPVVSAGWDYTVAAMPNGYVRAVGINDKGQCNVGKWTNIMDVSAGKTHTLGLKSDGTVVATGENADGQCDVKKWKDITAIAAGMRHSVGLKSDGTVVAVGYNEYGQCDVKKWKDIVAIAAGSAQTYGLKSNGKVVSTGSNGDNRLDIDDWKDIVAIDSGERYVVGLKEDGTVVAKGYNKFGQCDVDDWDDIVAISTGYNHTVGVCSDGTVLVAGRDKDGRLDVEDWEDVAAVSAGSRHTVGVQKDGTLVSCGYNGYTQCGITRW